jgi:hypothetical protein
MRRGLGYRSGGARAADVDEGVDAACRQTLSFARSLERTQIPYWLPSQVMIVSNSSSEGAA